MGRSPLLTLGPSWPFTGCLLFFAGMILTYFLLMLSMANNAASWHLYISYTGLGINLLALFGGILKNPGIPQPIIDRILKEQLGKGDDADEESDEDDEEKGLPSIETNKKVVQPQPYHWCRLCQIETRKDTYHCEDCLVCIDGYDHHCVFFSKCIGGGNI